MKVDLVGKIKNTQLPRSKALLPMLEAVVNSFQAIEEASKGQTAPRIEILKNRNFKRAFCLVRNVSKTSVRKQSPDFAVHNAGVPPASMG